MQCMWKLRIYSKTFFSGCEQYIEADKDVQFGFILPGHGKKGRQVPILLDSDLREMYKRYKKKTEILL